MKLIEKISADFMTAYKAKNLEKKNFLGVVKTEITKESKEPTDQFIIDKIRSMIKTAADTNSLSTDELETLNGYIPQQMGEADLKKLLEDFVNSTESVNIGSIMKHFNQNYKGLVDNKMLQKLSKEML
jgi:uncharacterized protein YqeY